MTPSAPMLEYNEGAKALPPLTVTGLHLWGWPVSEWLTLLTIVYVILQLYVLIRDKIIARKALHGEDIRE